MTYGPQRKTSGLKLTRRELAVLEQLWREQTDEAGAAALGITPQGFRSTLARAVSSLGAHNRVSALMRAMREGILPPPGKGAKP